MSTKFFTWTKGDRRHASEALRKDGIVPIPAECISIKGLGHGRSVQYSRKSDSRQDYNLPEVSPELPSTRSNRTNDSIALQDAAVQSATSLMAVMNDMLRSPAMSSHLFAQTYPPAMYGRPRSKTAPSTPMAEALPIEYVELPGSSPCDRTPSVDDGHSGLSGFRPILGDFQTAMGAELSRPHSSPQKFTHSSLSPPPLSKSPLMHHLAPSRSTNDPRTPKAPISDDHFAGGVYIGEAKDRPARSYSSESNLQASIGPHLLSISRNGSAYNIPQIDPESSQSLPQLQPHGIVMEARPTLLEEVAAMRRSHEAHVESMRTAHERELASHVAYISLLENQQKSVQAPRDMQLEDRDRKANESEKALKNAIADLEARLVAANNERTDVLEGYQDACAKIRELCQHESVPAVDSDTASNNTRRHRRAASDATRFTSFSSPVWQQMQELRRQLASKETQNRRLQHQVAEQSREIRTTAIRVAELERALETKEQMLDSARSDSERYNSLLHQEVRRQTNAAVQRAHFSTSKIEAEAFVVATEKLLRLKARRVDSTRTSESSKSSSQGTAPSVAMLERELEHCIKEIIMYKLDAKTYRKELRKAQAKIDGTQTTEYALQSPPPISAAENTKDTSRSTPEVTRSIMAHSRGNLVRTPEPAQPGLGISLSEQQSTPTRDIASSTSAALMSPSPPPALNSPASRPRTPLRVHKRLPRPPLPSYQRPLPPSPPPSGSKNLQRNETLRSLSESIIPSYASRAGEGLAASPHHIEDTADS